MGDKILLQFDQINDAVLDEIRIILQQAKVVRQLKKNAIELASNEAERLDGSLFSILPRIRRMLEMDHEINANDPDPAAQFISCSYTVLEDDDVAGATLIATDVTDAERTRGIIYYYSSVFRVGSDAYILFDRHSKG